MWSLQAQRFEPAFCRMCSICHVPKLTLAATFRSTHRELTAKCGVWGRGCGTQRLGVPMGPVKEIHGLDFPNSSWLGFLKPIMELVGWISVALMSSKSSMCHFPRLPVPSHGASDLVLWMGPERHMLLWQHPHSLGSWVLTIYSPFLPQEESRTESTKSHLRSESKCLITTVF